MNDYDMSIHQNPDAKAWAEFFLQTIKEQNWSIDDIDEDLMIGWFANAMMAMHDHVCIKNERKMAQLEQERDQLRSAISLAIDAFHKYEMDVDTYPTTEHVRMMTQLNGVLSEHDAQVIKLNFKRLSEEYIKHPRDVFTGFEIAQHLEAQGIHYANQLRQKAQEKQT